MTKNYTLFINYIAFFNAKCMIFHDILKEIESFFVTLHDKLYTTTEQPTDESIYRKI